MEDAAPQRAVATKPDWARKARQELPGEGGNSVLELRKLVSEQLFSRGSVPGFHKDLL